MVRTLLKTLPKGLVLDPSRQVKDFDMVLHAKRFSGGGGGTKKF
jgi:hypothetical protein